MKSPKLVIFTLLLLVVALIGLCSYIYIQKNKLNSDYTKQTEQFNGLIKLYDDATQRLKDNSEKDSAEKLSKKYSTYSLLSNCGIGLNIPDESNQYDTVTGLAKTWRLRSDEVANEEKKDPFVEGYKYSISLRNDSEASGYIAEYISVRCKANDNELTTDTLTTNYLKYVSSQNKAMEVTTGAKATDFVVKKEKSLKKWGVDVNQVTIERNSIAEKTTESGYIFAWGGKIYYIYSTGMSTDKKAIKSVASILDSLYLYK